MPNLTKSHTNVGLARQDRIRLTPVLHLESGEEAGLLAEVERNYEERAVFGRANRLRQAMAVERQPAVWFGQSLQRFIGLAHNHAGTRPLLVPVPQAAFIDQDLCLLADAAIRQTPLCHQEVCLDISDSTILAAGKTGQRTLEGLLRMGFRLSLDATRSWQASLSLNLRLLFESYRISARALEEDSQILSRLEAADAAGLRIIASHASWHEASYLERLGIRYGLRPSLNS